MKIKRKKTLELCIRVDFGDRTRIEIGIPSLATKSEGKHIKYQEIIYG